MVELAEFESALLVCDTRVFPLDDNPITLKIPYKSWVVGEATFLSGMLNVLENSRLTSISAP